MEDEVAVWIVTTEHGVYGVYSAEYTAINVAMIARQKHNNVNAIKWYVR